MIDSNQVNSDAKWLLKNKGKTVDNYSNIYMKTIYGIKELLNYYKEIDNERKRLQGLTR